METNLLFFPMLADSGIELVVFLVIAAISALVNWIQKKKQGETDWSEVETPPGKPAPRPGTPPVKRPVKRLDWEEELRRMLEGDEEEERPRPAPAPAPMPPVIRETKPPVAPMPVPEVRPVSSRVQGLSRQYKAHCEHCGVHIEFASEMLGETIFCPQCHQRTTLHPFGDTKVEQMQHPSDFSPSKEYASAFERASHLSETTATRLHTHSAAAVAARNVSTQPRRSPEVEKVVSLLQSPQTARQAIVASVILGPPKALEGQPGISPA